MARCQVFRDTGNRGRLLDTKSRCPGGGIGGSEHESHFSSLGIQLHPIEAARVEREPEPDRRQIHALPECVQRREQHAIGCGLHIAAKRLPSELTIVYQVSGGIEAWPRKFCA